MTPPFASRVTVAPDVLFRLVSGEGVVLNLKTEVYLGLDPVGARMWTLLTESASIQDAYEALLAEYDVAPEQLQEDIRVFVDQLLAKGLVTVAQS